jgi:hypothetical protein
MLPEFPSPSLFSQLLLSFSLPSSILTLITLFFFPFNSPFLVLILSRFFKTAGSQVGELADPHIHPHSHIMSPTDRHIILYLIVFVVAGSRVGGFQDFISLVP